MRVRWNAQTRSKKDVPMMESMQSKPKDAVCLLNNGSFVKITRITERLIHIQFQILVSDIFLYFIHLYKRGAWEDA